MPCYRCGARQVDPVRGHSPWRRGVRGNVQVLVCPACQESDWTADMDKCRRCGSAHLVRRLGEVECRDCGAVPAAADPISSAGVPGAGPPDVGPPDVGPPEAGPLAGGGPAEAAAPAGRAPGLAEEVAKALDRVLGRGAAGDRAAPALPAARGARPGDEGHQTGIEHS